jgi:hypothetical protein
MKPRQARKVVAALGVLGLSILPLVLRLGGPTSLATLYTAATMGGGKNAPSINHTATAVFNSSTLTAAPTDNGTRLAQDNRPAVGDADPTAAPSPPPPSPRLSHSDDGDDRDRPDGFSACLMWMDDNFRLVEWLAYHYYMLNLRYVVVHVDPFSQTRPYPVLDRWKRRMRVVVWTHLSNFTNASLYDYDSLRSMNQSASAEYVQKRTVLHRKRQLDFYHGCARHLKQRNRTWTSFHDNDEYVVATDAANVTARDIQQSPGAILAVFQQYSSRRNEPQVVNRYNATEAFQFRDWDVWFSAKPCVVLPRVFVSAKESSEADVAKGVPDFLDPYRFDTLRWRHQGTKRDFRGGLGKGFVDLSWLPYEAINGTTGHIHQPFGDKYCTHPKATADGLPLMLNHYVGSWEEYSHRDNDARKGGFRSFETWKKRSGRAWGGINDLARPWIAGFVKMLLMDAGLPRNYTMSENETAEWARVAGGG